MASQTKLPLTPSAIAGEAHEQDRIGRRRPARADPAEPARQRALAGQRIGDPRRRGHRAGEVAGDRGQSGGGEEQRADRADQRLGEGGERRCGRRARPASPRHKRAGSGNRGWRCETRVTISARGIVRAGVGGLVGGHDRIFEADEGVEDDQRGRLHRRKRRRRARRRPGARPTWPGPRARARSAAAPSAGSAGRARGPRGGRRPC